MQEGEDVECFGSEGDRGEVLFEDCEAEEIYAHGMVEGWCGEHGAREGGDVG